MPKAGFYAIKRGRQPGIYSTWYEFKELREANNECKAQVDGFPRAEYKRFGNLKDAENFIGVAYIETSLTLTAQTYEDSPSPSSAPSTPSRHPIPSSSAIGVPIPSSASRFNPYTPAVAVSKVKTKVETASTDRRPADEWITAYTDGACRGNGAAGAVAGVGVWYGDNDPRNVSERCPGAQTNNRAELIAIIRCLEMDLEPTQQLLIKSDSKYAMD
ncbi:hypothetical protein FRB90_007877, partial [Tulasnella sp. 427]